MKYIVDLAVSGKIREYGMVVALLLICGIFSITSPVFLTQPNIANILNQVAINAVLAVGATFVILSGGIDLGLGSYVAITGVLTAMSVQNEAFPLPVGLAVGLCSGTIIGLVNGVVITKGKIAPFVVTLGMMTITRGAALVISNGRPVSNLSDSFNDLSVNSLFGVQYPIIIVLVVIAAAAIILNKTIFGRRVYAVGGNDEATRAAGISVDRVKIYVYALAGGLAGLAGILQASRITTGQPNIGVGYELDAIAAVVIGGTSLSGGFGKLSGTIVGALIIGVINNGLDLLNVSSYYQQIVKGSIIIGALLLDINRKK